MNLHLLIPTDAIRINNDTPSVLKRLHTLKVREEKKKNGDQTQKTTTISTRMKL